MLMKNLLQCLKILYSFNQNVNIYKQIMFIVEEIRRLLLLFGG